MRARLIAAAVVTAGLTGLGLVVAMPAADAGGRALSHSQAAGQLRAARITWSSSGGCSDRNRPNCTSFTRIKSGTIKGVISFRKASRCAVHITGGTETGHAAGTYSHWNGYKVDISPTACVSNHIRRHYRSIGGGKWRSPAGNIYYNEGDHWDITYY